MATYFRTTWLGSSLLALRERGHFDRYLTFLPPQHHDAILTSVAGSWLPVEVAVEHYRACDRLMLSKAEMWEIGLDVTRRVHGTSLALMIRLAKQSGVTPWAALAQLNRLWERIWRGGGCAVYKAGPKEAIVEVIQWPCAEIPYVRRTIPSVLLGVMELFCNKAYVSDVPRLATASSLGMKVQWA
jgi:hypothetical protein